MDESKKVERELVAIQERQVHDDADDNEDNGHNVAESEDENDGEDDCNWWLQDTWWSLDVQKPCSSPMQCDDNTVNPCNITTES